QRRDGDHQGDDKEQRADNIGNRPQAGPNYDKTGHDQNGKERRTWALARDRHWVRTGLGGDGLGCHGRSPIDAVGARVPWNLSLFTLRAAQARPSLRSPRSTYDPVSLPRRPCVSAPRVAM